MRPTIKNQIRQMAQVAMVAIALSMPTLLPSCSKSSASPQDVVKAKLTANSWTMQTVMVDGVDKTSVYSGLTVQFTNTGFITTHGGVVWPASGMWSFNAPDGTSIKRDDGTVVGVNVTDTGLTLTLTWAQTTLGGGRSASVGGVNVFSFAK